ncbi:MarR family winged helix-turn-helix transcriptional regulator [Mycolicibacterium sp. P1-5]|uniref:MarR family winged helix-turn-helix transcriptional regulator n=1 Tax=Mycolicibacterium sp. P1-5 TaxID=2024617 RepID=UPI0011EC8425|nr:MarR family transcriptional regulator [Mycolicibacterium sp. P1-5]KAA0108647.1 MarR family transcriptional regulator [Mycolicibacterium sp. P1-5]
MTTDDEAVTEDSVDAITDGLLTASRLLIAVSARSIAQVDDTITIPQFRTLVILSGRGRMNLTTLAGWLDVQPSTTGRMIERLVATGLINRQAHPDSRRELVVELTSRGHEIVSAVTAHRRSAIARIVANMPPRERRGLVRTLNAFTAAGGEPAAHLEVHGYLA